MYLIILSTIGCMMKYQIKLEVVLSILKNDQQMTKKKNEKEYIRPGYTTNQRKILYFQSFLFFAKMSERQFQPINLHFSQPS